MPGLLRITVLLAFGATPLLALAGDSEVFDTVPAGTAAALLPPELAAGPDFHVVDPVQGDGLMNRFVLESRFGTFSAYGRRALAVRVREVAALRELARTSDIAIAAGGVVQGAESQVRTAAGVVTHPVETVVGIPKGIAHLFGGYRARGEEAAADTKRDLSAAGAGAADGGGEGVAHAADRGAHAANSYAEHYLGVTAAERNYYRKLGVDPYTDNQLLRDTVRHDARIRAAAGFGMKFVGLPGIPGIGLTQRAVDAIYEEDPAVIRRRTRATLAGYGLSAAEIDAFLNAPLLSPTRQVLLLADAESLAGVAGRGELFRHSLGLTAPEEVEVYLASVAILVKAHASEPVAAIVSGLRLPAALRTDGRLIVCGAFESIYWTAGVAQLEAQLEAAVPAQPQPVARELWVAGTLSDRARAALESRGWQLRPQNLPP
jgi:hypothetical protein